MNKPILHLEKASVFQRDILILKNVSLTMQSGEFAYLIGKTGSGKSSLMKTLYAELPLKDGLAYVADYSLADIRRKDIPPLRRKLGIVFQDFQLLADRSVTDNLLFIMEATGWTDKTKMKFRAEEVLRQVGLQNKGYKFPHQLSGGEQQRVAIARALINSPVLILADEPTGNLDPDTSAGIMSLLFEISQQGSAVLMATHNYNLIRKFPARVLRVEDASVIEEVTVFMPSTPQPVMIEQDLSDVVAKEESYENLVDRLEADLSESEVDRADEEEGKEDKNNLSEV